MGQVSVKKNNYVSYLDPNELYIDFSYDWQASSSQDVWNVESHLITPEELAAHPKPTVLNSTTYRQVDDTDGNNQECTVLSSAKVNAILDVAVDAIEIREFCRYGQNSSYGVGDGWSSYGASYASLTEFLNTLQTYGVGGQGVKLTADNKVQITATGEIISDSYWKIEDGVLKVKYWDEIWYKLDTDNKILENWIGDEVLSYKGITKEQAKQLTAKMGLPIW